MYQLEALIWLGFFAAAAAVWFSGRGNIWIVAGLITIGVYELVYALDIWGVFPDGLSDQDYETLPLVGFTGAVLLVIGFLSIARGGKDGGRMAGTKGLDLATLFTPRNETNSFSSADRLRDEACGRLVAKARAAGWEVVEQRSQAHSPNVWFRIDYLLPSPKPELSLTASVGVDIERFDFHRFEHTFTVTVQVGSRRRKIRGVTALDEDAIDRIHAFIEQPQKRLRLARRVRQWGWDLWRPLNKVKRLRPDWLMIGLYIVAFLLVLIPLVGIPMAIAAFIAIVVFQRRRQTYVLTSGKPLKDPRSLRWMDSWQASIGGLGGLAETVRQGVIGRLQKDAPEDARVEVEKIGYWGTDHWVEREQIVVTNRRAIGYIHVVPYGDTLYVAWECHLNTASWVEKQLAAGVDRESGLNVVANGVVAGTHLLNEYDVSDSNFLAEWMHEAVKREVKLRMAEHKIDQEIDFTVQRESRKDALGGRGEQDEKRKKSKLARFKRLA